MTAALATMARKKETLGTVLTIEEAVRAGHIRRIKGVELRVEARYAQTDHDLVTHYDRIEALDFEGALAMCGGIEKHIWELFNRSFDSRERIRFRQRLVRKAKGSHRALERMARAAVKGGLAKTEKEAMAALSVAYPKVKR